MFLYTVITRMLFRIYSRSIYFETKCTLFDVVFRHFGEQRKYISWPLRYRKYLLWDMEQQAIQVNAVCFFFDRGSRRKHIYDSNSGCAISYHLGHDQPNH